MLEIILLVSLCRKIGNRSREKGLPAGKYKFFVVVAWFGGEIAGAVFAAVMWQVFYGDRGGNDVLFTYACAIFTAAMP